MLGGLGYQPPEAPLSRGLEVHPFGSSDELEIWIDRDVVPAGYGWSFPARDEVRIGVGSFDPRHHVKDPTVKLAEDLGSEAVRFQGNWIPHRLRPATGGGIFYVGDSAGHCLPLTAEGIRTAFYFGIAAGREIRAVVEGQPSLEDGAGRATTPSRRLTSGSTSGCCGSRSSSRGSPRALLAARRFAAWRGGRSSSGRSTTTSTSRQPSFATGNTTRATSSASPAGVRGGVPVG